MLPAVGRGEEGGDRRQEERCAETDKRYEKEHKIAEEIENLEYRIK